MFVLLNLVASLLKLGNLKGNSAAMAMGMYLLNHTHLWAMDLGLDTRSQNVYLL